MFSSTLQQQGATEETEQELVLLKSSDDKENWANKKKCDFTDDSVRVVLDQYSSLKTKSCPCATSVACRSLLVFFVLTVTGFLKILLLINL